MSWWKSCCLSVFQTTELIKLGSTAFVLSKRKIRKMWARVTNINKLILSFHVSGKLIQDKLYGGSKMTSVSWCFYCFVYRFYAITWFTEFCRRELEGTLPADQPGIQKLSLKNWQKSQTFSSTEQTCQQYRILHRSGISTTPLLISDVPISEDILHKSLFWNIALHLWL